MSSGEGYFSESTPKVVIQSLFRKYDTDGSGVLERKELMTLLKDDLGMHQEQAETIIMVVDKDGSGTVDFDEFFQWLRDKNGIDIVDDKTRYGNMIKAVELFKKYDKDSSGTIEEDELKQLLKDFKYKGSVEDLDKDGNGKISFPEFLNWLNELPPQC